MPHNFGNDFKFNISNYTSPNPNNKKYVENNLSQVEEITMSVSTLQIKDVTTGILLTEIPDNNPHLILHKKINNLIEAILNYPLDQSKLDDDDESLLNCLREIRTAKNIPNPYLYSGADLVIAMCLKSRLEKKGLF